MIELYKICSVFIIKRNVDITCLFSNNLNSNQSFVVFNFCKQQILAYPLACVRKLNMFDMKEVSNQGDNRDGLCVIRCQAY